MMQQYARVDSERCRVHEYQKAPKACRFQVFRIRMFTISDLHATNTLPEKGHN
jgi:hypothetical protein